MWTLTSSSDSATCTTGARRGAGAALSRAPEPDASRLTLPDATFLGGPSERLRCGSLATGAALLKPEPKCRSGRSSDSELSGTSAALRFLLAPAEPCTAGRGTGRSAGLVFPLEARFFVGASTMGWSSLLDSSPELSSMAFSSCGRCGVSAASC